MKHIQHIIYFTLLYATVFSFLIRRKYLTQPLRILFVNLIIYTLFNSANMLLQLLGVKNNLFLSHIHTPVEYTLLAIIYYQILEVQGIKTVILISAPCFIITALLLTLFIEGWKVNDSYAKTVESLLIIVWILIYFYQILTTEKILTMQQDPMFWVSAGYLSYFICELFIQGTMNEMILKDKGMASNFYHFQYIFEYNLFIQINIALFCHRIFKGRIPGTEKS